MPLGLGGETDVESEVISNHRVSDLEGAHSHVDANGDGKLTREEVFKALFEAKAWRRREEIQDQSQSSAYEHVKGNMTLEDIIAEHSTEVDSAGKPIQDDETVERFHLADFDGNGRLTEEEHHAYLHPASSATMLERTARHELKKMDSNGDGTVDIREFAKATPFGEDESGNITKETELKFAGFDADGDKVLEVDEMLASKSRSEDFNVIQELSHDLIVNADNNSDELIDTKEFTQHFQRSEGMHTEAAQLLASFAMKKHRITAPVGTPVPWWYVGFVAVLAVLFFAYFLRLFIRP